MRTGVYTGSACLTCSTRLRKDLGTTKVEEEREFTPSRGGGFMLNSPRRPTTRGGGGTPGIGGAMGKGLFNAPAIGARPSTVPTRGVEEMFPQHASHGASTDRLSHVEPGSGPQQPRSGALGNGFGFDSNESPKQPTRNSKAEVGSDGKIYTTPGSRTHRFISPQKPGAAVARPGSGAAAAKLLRH